MEYFSMRGHLGQYVIVFPKENIMIVRLGKRNDKKTEANIYPDDQLTFIEEGLKMIKV
jgi:CubicO group peptidase (beta-lactamase class C family)